MQKIEAGETSPYNGGTISLRCPHCRQQGTFEALLNVSDSLCKPTGSGTWKYLTGQRRCPNPKCRAQIFFVSSSSAFAEIVASYPPERFDFDASSVPEKIVRAMEEAIACDAVGAFTAAAIMVRKTLELLCEDRGAQGDNLKARIKALEQKVILPPELLEATDDLRLLGNDAAHVEAKTYDEVGKAEVEVALDLTKEILKATYQYTNLLGRLRGLRKDTASAPKT